MTMQTEAVEEGQMLQSMTGFGAGKGAMAPYSWSLEIRSVNAKGLDLRLRVPDWIDGLETALRARLGKALGRGNVTLSLRVHRDDSGGNLTLNHATLAEMLHSLAAVEEAAKAQGVALAPTSAADLLNLRGVLDQGSDEEASKALGKAILEAFEPVLQQFLEMRGNEGRALHEVLTRSVDEIETLVNAIADVLVDRKAEVEQALHQALQRVLQNTDKMDPDRITQELALIAVKSDVTEELDRLRAHIGAARELLQLGKPVGRKLDFLMQEFNREANTLCSKSQNTALTRIGLDLKTVIDQMREQVQNVE